MSAVISECGRFRYLLIREWDVHLPRVAFVMLNPSTADADKDGSGLLDILVDAAMAASPSPDSAVMP